MSIKRPTLLPLENGQPSADAYRNGAVDPGLGHFQCYGTQFPSNQQQMYPVAKVPPMPSRVGQQMPQVIAPPEQWFQLGNNRYVVVKLWKGRLWINIRQYVFEDHQWKPTRTGINMVQMEWINLKEQIDQIQAAVDRLGPHATGRPGTFTSAYPPPPPQQNFAAAAQQQAPQFLRQNLFAAPPPPPTPGMSYAPPLPFEGFESYEQQANNAPSQLPLPADQVPQQNDDYGENFWGLLH